ncbi:MAG: hypothetical protein ACKOBW_15895 [Planctomycetota bacterium]
MQEIVVAELVREETLLGRIGRLLTSLVNCIWDWSFGLVSMLIGLAILATFPLLQFISLGYLLEVSGRVARSGRLRDGLIGIRLAARVGSMALGCWLCLWPLRFTSDLWYSSWLIDPDSRATRGCRVALVLLTILLIFHLAWACFRGGRLRHFFWPQPLVFWRRIRRGGMYQEARDQFWRFLVELRLGYFFWLGLRGFVGAISWLFLPVLLLIAAFKLPPALGALAGVGGALSLAIVAMTLPLLQTQFAAEGRLAAFFELRAAWSLFRRAPLASWFSLLVMLLFALPLYLLKIEFLQREVAWLPSLVFVAFIAPARLLCGWALGRARRRERPRFFLSWLTAGPAMIPIVLFYVFIVYLSRYTSWYGSWSLFEQHAFLLPVPFLGL